MPIARYVEYLTPCDYIDGITTAPFELDAEGFLRIPELPGLGIELDHDKLKKFRG
jgi:L-alanine-DL-glutamate epimerase-like enolase superfamily enzyme